MYNTYEEYMQKVLGYNMQNTYNSNGNNNPNYYVNSSYSQNIQEMNKLYPEIYTIIYPLIQKVCSKKKGSSLTESELTQMVDEIYQVVETDEKEEQEEVNRKNGDVRNPRAREVRRQNPPKNNYLLRDLIRILILRELIGNNAVNPVMSPNMFGNMNSPMPPRVPILRPRILSC